MICGFALLFALLAICFNVSQGDRASAEIVYPERIHRSRSKRDLSTELKDKQHEDSFTIRIKSKQGDMIIDLKKNEEIYPGSLLLRTYDDDGEPKHERVFPRNCYYSGKVRGQPQSDVYLSTYRGLTGSVDTGDKRFDIEPYDEEGGHKYYSVDDEIEEIIKKLSKSSSDVSGKVDENEDTQSTSTYKAGHKITTVKKAAKSERPYELINVEDQYIPYLTTNHTRYVEMFLSADHQMYRYYNNDTDLVLERILHAVGQVDKSYSAINIRLVVVAAEVQTNGPAFQRSSDGGTDLHNFNKHYLKLKKEDEFKNIRMDNAQLFSHHAWINRVIGMGYVGGLCGRASGAVTAWSYKSISGPSAVLGHEIGHNVGFPHDVATRCKCLTRRGCFMGGPRSGRPGFSDCSMRKLAEKIYPCINDYPINPLSSICGNGIKEKDEECDCGTPENCEKNDPCCKPHHCVLKEEAQCNFINNPLCCNKTCQLKKQGTMCREAASNCDVPEYCTGDFATCPADRVMVDGTHCGESKKLLLGTRRRRIKTKELTPRLAGQYFKFVPKYWKKNGYACMKLEMHGCASSEDSSSHPTSIATPLVRYTSLCLTPDITSCKNVTDGTRIIYKRAVNNDCNHPHMMFVHQADGTIIHECSGKKVCPRSDYYLILSSNCYADNSRYIRTAGWSLKHNKTGRCVCTSDRRPNSDEYAILIRTCDGSRDRTKLLMRNVDCSMPLGFQNGKLPETAFSAGSYHKSRTANDIRINKNAWCPRSKEDGSWFQVDFGKKVEVRYISIAGTSRNWVTGYYLMYSDNGVLWKYYKESSATRKDMNSLCYGGVCALTYDHQCKQLWNADAKSASKKCWNDLNTRNDGYGTCNATAIMPCSKSDVMCGQLQCTSQLSTPYYQDYGKNYTTLTVDGERCSAAIIVGSNDEVGLGMVTDGTKCGNGKLCIGQQCKSSHGHGIIGCATENGTVCDGRGHCLDNGKCFCDSGYDPEIDCKTMLAPVHGKWSAWSSWSTCTKACNDGQHRRHRFCNNPAMKHGGNDCAGKRVEEEECNKDACIVGRTCKDIKTKMEHGGKQVMDGVYRIEPTDSHSLKVYCDMTRDGGGWTLIVSSHTNTWTAQNVRLRNEDTPDLYNDSSILQYANELKENYLIKDDKFQYRLEANYLGKWGGIWEAPVAYDMASTNPAQGDVNLLKKFSDWEYSSSGLQQRLPYIDNQRLTVGKKSRKWWGCITDNTPGFHPSRWINGKQKMTKPEHVWYWLREGDYVNPNSCLEIMFRGFGSKTRFSSGVYLIEPEAGKPVQTFCDFDRHGGGWTLLVNSSGSGGWNPYNILNRNWDDGKSNEYSIFGLVHGLKGNDIGEKSFDYMVEADGNDQNGGIFSLPVLPESMMKCSYSGLKPTLIEKFGNWDERIENIAKYPIRPLCGVLLGAMRPIHPDFSAAISQEMDEVPGAVISVNEKRVYMTSYKNPSSIKLWIRGGGSRKSCNDLKIHGYHKGKTDYIDGFYMLKGSQPVYCDMTTTDKEGWTLLVTSASNGWSKEQVKLRNQLHPSLYHDYSILGQADSIKSLSTDDHFKYMLSAQKRGHWGGIWKAPMKYSFTSTKSNLRDVELITKFDNWSYDIVWYRGPCRRMPYLETRVNKQRGLLTTADYSDYTEWGTIVSNNSDQVPSKWINPEMRSPGVIWYWVNENDCDANYTKVDGEYSVSSWSSCSVFCGGDGLQVRTRRCDNPAPSCGGDPCDLSQKSWEKRHCSTPCLATQIVTPDGNFCLQPEKDGCYPVEDTKIVMRPTNKYCKGAEALFVFNPNKGEITHRCSNATVCFINGNSGDPLIISRKCPKNTREKHFQRTQFNTIYFDKLVVRPSGGIGDGNNLVLSSGGMATIEKFLFTNKTFNQGFNKGHVKALYWKNAGVSFYQNDPRYPNKATSTGFVDNLETPARISNHYAMQLTSYFKAPETGYYTFKAACDDACQVYLSYSEDPLMKKRIINVNKWTSRYQWSKYSEQTARSTRLIVGKRYYIEARMRETSGGDHMEIGVILPSGEFLEPITSEYLSN